MELVNVVRTAWETLLGESIAVGTDGKIYVCTIPKQLTTGATSVYLRAPSDAGFNYWNGFGAHGDEYISSASIVVDSAGVVWGLIVGGASWWDNQGLAFEALSSDSGSFYGPVNIDDDGSHWIRNPQIMLDSSGNKWITYEKYSNHGGYAGPVYFCKRNVDGSAAIAATLVTNTGENAIGHFSLIDNNNRLWVGWYSNTYDKFYLKIFNSDGTVYVNRFEFYTETGSTLSCLNAIVDLNGRIWIFIMAKESGDSYRYIYFKVFNSDGTEYKSLTKIPGQPDENVVSVQPTQDAAGKIYLLSITNAGNYNNLYLTKMSVDYTYSYAPTLLFVANQMSALATSWRPVVFNTDYLIFAMVYNGWESIGVVTLQVDETLPAEVIFAKIGLLY